MQSEQFSQRFNKFLNKSLFQERELPPSFPWVALNGSIISVHKKPNALEGLGITYDESDLKKSAEIFKDHLPNLTLIELAYIHSEVKEKPILDFQHLLKICGYHSNEILMTTLGKIQNLPEELNEWFHHKKVGIQDLAPLRSIADLTVFETFFKQIASFQLGRHEGLKIIEWGIDLVLLGHPLEKILYVQKEKETAVAPLWISQLESLRYPKTLKIRDNKQRLFESVNWPGKSKSKFVQRGDLLGVELSIFFSSPGELERISNQLLQIAKTTDSTQGNSNPSQEAP